MPEQGYLEIYPAGTSKAEAIKQLAQLVEADEIVVFGDNVNDIPMFDIAHRSYAPDNALDVVKQRATQVIASNDKDGVVEFLEQDYHR
jgi:hydroxymethylpyrimidine pyrophosphatase-like HAD family hydrolase